MKKTIAMLLAIVMVFGMMPVSVFAEGNPNFYFETTFEDTMDVGDSFTVVAYFENNPTFGTMTLDLEWNEEVLKFNGFDANARGILTSEVFDTSSGYQAPVINQEDGIIVSVDYLGYDLNGALFTANFEIIGEGELDLHFNENKYEIKNLDGSADVVATIDYSAIENLHVGQIGPVIPDGAPFTTVTTDAGAAITVEDCGVLEVDPWGGMPVEVPYYHIAIPAEATEAYVRFDQPISAFMSQTAMDGTPEIGSAWACVNDYESGMAGLLFEDMGDYTNVIIPLEFNGDPWGGEDMKSTVKTDDEYELYYAVGPQDAGSATIAVFSLEYYVEKYTITIDENMVGGTLTVVNEQGQPVTEAAAGDSIFVTVKPAAGYSGNSYTINGEMANDVVFEMPAENVVLSATFNEDHTCSYTESVVDVKYQKSEATCQSGAVYYKSCTCGEFATTAETFVSGESVDCVYENNVCKWCGEPEPVVTPGYRFATSADVSAENGGTATVHVKITGHSDETVTSYNAYDITLTFDSNKLEYKEYAGAVKNDGGKVVLDGNTIRIVGCGATKDFGTEIAALTFVTKAEGAADVTIEKVQVSDKEESVKEDAPEATAEHAKDDTTADETPDVSVIVVPYTVTKTDFISGNIKALHGESYTFSYTDTDNYTYSDLTVKVGGVEVTPTEANGIYTIANVTGAIEINATQTPNSYDVTKPENVTGPNQATYREDYIFTVTPSAENMAIDTVKVTLADGTEISYTINENGEYVIAGTDIAGAFTITVTEKEIPATETTITFTGINENDIVGGLNQSATIGEDFEFVLVKDNQFAYTVKVGETPLEEIDGKYIIPGELVVADGVTVTITKTAVAQLEVAVTNYFNVDGNTMVLVTANWGDKTLAWGNEGTMFYSSKYQAYCWLVMTTEEMKTMEAVKAEAEQVIAEATGSAIEIAYNYDINGTTKVDVNDAQLAYDMYNASYKEFTQDLPMRKFLEADVNYDMKLDTTDVAAVINYILADVNN